MLLEMQSPTCDWAFGQRGALSGGTTKSKAERRWERLTRERGVLHSGSQGRHGTEAAVPTDLLKQWEGAP